MTNLTIAFLIIVTLSATCYAFVINKTQIALGLLLMSIAFIVAIPDLATGFFSSILLALSIIIYTAGLFVLVKNKKENINTESDQEKNA